MNLNDLRSSLWSYYMEELGYPSNIKIFDISLINAGWESDIYTFDLIVGDHPPQALILRIYPGMDSVEKSEREYSNLNKLNQIGFPVPEAYILEQDRSHLGNPFIIIERIPGKMLWEVLFSSQEEGQLELIDSFSRLFVQLHNLDFELFKENHLINVDQEPGSLISTQINLWYTYFKTLPIPEFLPLLDWLAENSQGIQGSKTAILHWDFHPGNVILRPDKSMVVIDWTSLQVSDPRFDLAWTLMLITAYEGEKWREPFLEAYERHVGEKVDQLEFFDVAACTRRLFSIAASIAAGAEHMGMRPGAEKIMKKQIAPAQTVYDQLLKLTGIRLPVIEDWLV